MVTAAVTALVLLAANGVDADERAGPTSAAVTVEAARTRARASNRELRAAAQEVEVARGDLLKARRLMAFNPEIGGEAGHRERNESGESGTSSDFAVTLSQEIEVAGQRGARIQEATRNLEHAEAVLHDRERLLDAEVQRTFFRALADARRVELLRAVEDLARRVRDAAAARVTAGQSAALEANLAAIRYGEARKETLTAGAERAANLAALRRLLDLDPDVAVEPTGELRPAGAPPALPELLERARSARPDLVAALREGERVEAEQRLTRRLVVPNPTVEVFHREEERGPDRVTGAGVRLPLPLFDRKQGELAALAARATQARLQVAAVRREAEDDVAAALARYAGARRAAEVYDQDVTFRVVESLRFVETSYREGKIDLFQLVVVQNDLVSAQLSYLDTLLRLREAAIDLEQAVGTPTL